MDSSTIARLYRDKPRHAGREISTRAELLSLLEDVPGDSIAERSFNLCFPERLSSSTCPSCQTPFKSFVSFHQGHRKFCSQRCSARSPDTRAQAARTNVERFGVPNPLGSPEIRAKIIKTNLKKFGVSTPLLLSSTQDKVRETLKARYGVDHAFKVQKVKDKATLRHAQAYRDHGWPRRLEHIERAHHVKFSSLLRDNMGVDASYDWTHTCGEVFSSKIVAGGIRVCPKCKVEYRSRGESDLADFIKANFHGEIVLNTRALVPPYEIDIYVPMLDLAVEFNGLYWHSSAVKRDNYHLQKTEKCEVKGIKLIQIFEDEWYAKPEIVKSRLLSELNKTRRIYARSCEVRDVSSGEARTFLEENHLQGAVGSRVRLGLYENDNLISLMTFGRARFNKTAAWELLRYTSALGTTVVGGASRLLMRFKRANSGAIISYADRRWSNGNLYRQLGFTELPPSRPSYFYLWKGRRLSRLNAQKHMLKDLLGDKFNPKLTEVANMEAYGCCRVFDCGNRVFRLDK